MDLERTLLEAKRLFADLTASHQEIAKLREGLLTVCAWTKRIRYDGRWMGMDEFLMDHLHLNLTRVSYTHLDVYKRQGLCFARTSDWL